MIKISSLISLLITINAIESALKINEYNSIASIHSEIISGRQSCKDIIKSYLERVYEYNPKINALISLNSHAITHAKQLDETYEKNGKKLTGRLHCVPITLKDNINFAQMPTTGGIKVLRNLVPNKHAEVVSVLVKEGAVVIGKANMAELATGRRQVSEMGGACRNPYDTRRTCATSSSGSAASIASGMAVASLGTDTAGSITYPSAMNGLYGLRPALDTIKMNGVLPLMHYQDTVGPITKNIDDLVAVYSALASNFSIFDEYFREKGKEEKFRVGYISDFFETRNFMLMNMSLSNELDG